MELRKFHDIQGKIPKINGGVAGITIDCDYLKSTGGALRENVYFSGL
jgi:hypothetical protein